MARAQNQISYSYLFKRTIWFRGLLNAMMSCLVAFYSPVLNELSFKQRMHIKKRSTLNTKYIGRIQRKREKLTFWFFSYFDFYLFSPSLTRHRTYLFLLMDACIKHGVYLSIDIKIDISDNFDSLVHFTVFDLCRWLNNRDTSILIAMHGKVVGRTSQKANSEDTTQSKLMNILC